MNTPSKKRKTTVGNIDAEVLAFTAGQDVRLDLELVEADCLGTAAHVTMLSRLPLKKKIFTETDRKKVLKELAALVRQSKQGKFVITLEDQDVHLAVERMLTRKLGDLGKKVHTGRSRNDQVAVDLRLYGKHQLLATLGEVAELTASLMDFARDHLADPMVGRTHMQPAMPSSVGLWSSAHAESLLDDAALLITAYDINDQCPLGSAASYGVPLPIDRQLTSDLLGFSRPSHNVLYANNARGKIEAIILQAMSQVMLTLSRLAQDLILFSMPEFDYFSLPADFCTGSSIMPQKKNPDVLELIRAKTSKVIAYATAVQELIKAAPSGYNRDLQEAKQPFMEGISITRASLRIMTPLVRKLKINRKKLLAAFAPGVFATDTALELVAQGVPFRDAYDYVKGHLDELESADPYKAIAIKTHLGGTAGLNCSALEKRAQEIRRFVREESDDFRQHIVRLLGR